jgi:hypothetical protein
MRLVVVLAIVGGLSLAAARTILQGFSHRTLIGNNHRVSSPSKRRAKPVLVMASLTVAIFVPLLLVAYVAIGLVLHALGQ